MMKKIIIATILATCSILNIMASEDNIGSSEKWRDGMVSA